MSATVRSGMYAFNPEADASPKAVKRCEMIEIMFKEIIPQYEKPVFSKENRFLLNKPCKSIQFLNIDDELAPGNRRVTQSAGKYRAVENGNTYTKEKNQQDHCTANPNTNPAILS
jgi:hypothetical protein